MLKMGQMCHCNPCVCASDSQFTITIAGVANGTCAVCNNWNRTWTITKGVPTITLGNDECTWFEETNPATKCSGIALRIGLYTATFSQFFFSERTAFGYGTHAVYNVGAGDLDCEGTTPASLSSSSGDCVSWPATISIVRV